uniref:Serpin 5 n=1 Tax=Rhipicephalus haemaphysaloides TaxID=237073 RepID=A0A7L7SCS0_RHIHE|nr:serpin 5 [Rhipicephalus haemaphysaloides]
MKPLVAVAAILALSCFQLSLCQTDKEHRLIAANNAFAIHLLKVLPSLPNENVFFSPYSLSTALGMTVMGARGDTLEELSQALGYSALSLSESDIREAFAHQNNRLQAHARQAGLEVANSAAVQEGFNVIDSYYDTLNRTFNAHVFNVDFQGHGQQAVDTINEWVKQATHNKIDKLFHEPLDTDTRLVLMNAILFKGFWERQFDPSQTTKQVFYNGGVQGTPVDTMFLRHTTKRGFSEELQSKVLELPYRDSDYSMVIVLPQERDGADAVKQVLTIDKLNIAIGSLNSAPVAISLPKFKIDKMNPLKSNLTHLGLRKMFGSEADLSGITGDRRLYVSDVLQRAMVEVNEEGTEAAAVSGVVSVNRIGIEPFPFTADHPFLFFIRDRKTNEIFFAGQVNAL